jgi:hypothetical protein
MAGFHEGEIAVQARAGVRAEGMRLEGMLEGNYVAGPMGKFLAERNVAFITTVDEGGRLWTSPLFAERGFLQAGGFTLGVRSLPVPGDPLHTLQVGAQIGLVTIEFRLRRRLRISGTVAAIDSDGFTIAIDQAYGNCPKYIQQRLIEVNPDQRSIEPEAAEHIGALRESERAIITGADTFFLGTVHPTRGADCSHRGGTPGFVRVAETALWWPDYLGNNMFNSFGNISVDSTASLLFIDFECQRVLHLSGEAALGWDEFGPGDDGQTGRRVRFFPQAIVALDHRELIASQLVPYQHNPALTAAEAAV